LVSPATVQQRLLEAPAGVVTVRPAAGASATITGNISLSRASVTLETLTINGVVEFLAGANGSRLSNSTARGFAIRGADGIVIEGNTLDGQGQVAQNWIHDTSSSQVPDNWVIRNNQIRNYYVAGSSTAHTEGIFVGYSTTGLIEGNTFTNNGTTAHLFFSWFGATANPATSYPRNICVRSNTFNKTYANYYAIQFRTEIPTSANIKIAPSNVFNNVGAPSANPQFNGPC
jgi:hypothetical protein